MTQAVGGVSNLKPSLRLERTETTERIEVTCPAGSQLSIQDNFISCRPAGAAPSPQRPPDIDRPMNLGPALVDNAIKVADDARRGGYHNSARTTLSAVIPKLGDVRDLMKLASFAVGAGYSQQVNEAMSATAQRLSSPREAIQAAEVARRGGYHNAARQVADRGIAVARSSQEANEVANWAKSHGYSAQANAGFARATELMLQGR